VGHRKIACSVAIAGASLSALASAQNIASQPDTLGSFAKSSDTDLTEIVVTREKRDIKLIDTPASVTVFDSAKIESSGIVAPSDFVMQTSNVTYTTVVNPGDFLVNIRGVSSIRGGEPTVALGVILNRSRLWAADDLGNRFQNAVLVF
jgi:iron complex outermembrane recepter protein